MNSARSLRIESPEQSMNRTSPTRFPRCQSRPEIGIPFRSGREPIDQRAQIEARAAGNHRQMPALRNLVQNRTRHASIMACREYLIGVQCVYQVMPISAPLAQRGLCRSDVEVSKDLD